MDEARDPYPFRETNVPWRNKAKSILFVLFVDMLASGHNVVDVEARLEYLQVATNPESSTSWSSQPRRSVRHFVITAYRLGTMYEAEFLREQIGLKFTSIFDIDPSRGLAKISDRQLTMKTWLLLLKYEINTTPIGIRRPYVKPLQYLTLALVETFQSWEAIEGQVKAMTSKKKATDSSIRHGRGIESLMTRG